MTISTAASPLSYAGDDATVAFAITWAYQAKSHVVATLRDSAGAETTQTLTTHYTLTAAGATGTLTMITAPATNETLVITLEPPNTQTTDIPRGGSFPASSVEDALDLASQVDAKINALWDRAFRVPKTDTRSGSQLEIDNETTRASKYFGFDSSGDPTVLDAPTTTSTTTAFTTTLLDDSTANMARGTLQVLNDLDTIAGTNTITAEANPTLTAYSQDATFMLIPANSTTGAATLNIDGIGAGAIQLNGAALTGGELQAGVPAILQVTATTPVYEIVGNGAFMPLSGGIVMQHTNNFRLSLTSGTAVTTSDVSAGGTVYMALHNGNQIALYTGSKWIVVTSAELSIAVSTSANKVFDIFLDYNAGTPALKITDWTNDTTRATALTTQDGVLVQTGNTDWRYLGTARTKTASQVDDALAFRHLWNYYNRVKRPMRVLEATDTWTYTTATIRQANGSTANQLDFVIGVQEDMVEANIWVAVTNSTVAIQARVGIGVDSTSTFTSGGIFPLSAPEAAARMTPALASYKETIAIGRHFLSWNEYSVATGTCTWQGDLGAPTLHQAGINGSIRA